MSRFRFVTFIILGSCILVLVPILSNALTQMNEKQNPVPPGPVAKEKPPVPPRPGRDNLKPRPEPAKGNQPIQRVADQPPAHPMPWFAELDTDGDGKISPQEWRSKRDSDEFREMDFNGDGFLSPEELLYDGSNTALRLRKGRAEYHGRIEENGEERYKGTRTFKILTVSFEKGKTYQITVTSKLFGPFVFLEDPGGKPLARNVNAFGGNSRIRHQAEGSGIYRIVVTSFRTGPFSCLVHDVDSEKVALPPALSTMLKDLDKDEDNQIGLYEWLQAKKKLDTFRSLDGNNDGFITIDELLNQVKDSVELKFQNGKATHNGEVEERDTRYRNKRSYKLLTVRMERGKTYRIDLTSKVFQSFLHLEDAEGNLLKEHSSAFIGGNSQITFQPDRPGMYRIVATSLGGFRTGPFICTVSSMTSIKGPNLPKALMSWFKELDNDEDNQIGLYEWLKAKRSAADFRAMDLNADGFITREELRLYAKQFQK